MLDTSFGIGSVIGRLKIISLDRYTKEKGEARHYYKCLCECGNTVVAQRNILKRGSRKSCGCLLIGKNRKHGERNTRLYGIWVGMRKRCRNNYKYWGGRGIKVCADWDTSYEAFRDWAKVNGYEDDLSIDRRDNDGNYCPENCRFVTDAIQNRNTRQNKYVSSFGETKCLMDWFKDPRCVVQYSSFKKRLKRGMSVADALFIQKSNALLA